MRRVWGLAGVACVLAFLVSCGGGSDSSSATSSIAASNAVAAPLRATAKSPLAAALALDNTAVFTYAQWHYPQLFSGGYDTGVLQGYTYRHYPNTGNYLGISNGEIYVLGPAWNNQITHVGSMASFECQVLPANCPNTATPATPGVAISGFYYFGDSGIMLMAADGTFVGFNPGTSRADVFAGIATVDATSWSAPNPIFGQYSGAATVATRAAATIGGTYSTATSLTATFSATGVVPVNSRVAMDYHPQSRSPASMWMVGGTYRTPSAGQSVTIDPDTGSISGNFATNCTIAGTLSLPDANRNIYKVTVTLAGAACPVQGEGKYLAMYYDQGVENQALLLYGISTGADLTFNYLNLFRNGDGL